ncbi:MAG TPA: hypothetical protein VGR87_02670 [Candidatus Limnocylindria bacterium]|nr:hypothetical protein [Candidatus Limnocylindria bacterium]
MTDSVELGELALEKIDFRRPPVHLRQRGSLGLRSWPVSIEVSAVACDGPEEPVDRLAFSIVELDPRWERMRADRGSSVQSELWDG